MKLPIHKPGKEKVLFLNCWIIVIFKTMKLNFSSGNPSRIFCKALQFIVNLFLRLSQKKSYILLLLFSVAHCIPLNAVFYPLAFLRFSSYLIKPKAFPSLIHCATSRTTAQKYKARKKQNFRQISSEAERFLSSIVCLIKYKKFSYRQNTKKYLFFDLEIASMYWYQHTPQISAFNIGH